jgi:hypothetical protein
VCVFIGVREWREVKKLKAGVEAGLNLLKERLVEEGEGHVRKLVCHLAGNQQVHELLEILAIVVAERLAVANRTAGIQSIDRHVKLAVLHAVHEGSVDLLHLSKVRLFPHVLKVQEHGHVALNDSHGRRRRNSRKGDDLGRDNRHVYVYVEVWSLLYLIVTFLKIDTYRFYSG